MSKAPVMSVRKTVLLSLIAVLLVVYILQLCLTGRSNAKTFKVELPDTVTIQEGDGQPAALYYVDNKWVVGEKKYAADEARAKKIAESVASIKMLSAVDSYSDVKADRYGLTEGKRITVTASKNGKLLRTLVLGNSVASGDQSYALLDQKNTIYLASGGLNSTFKTNEESLRSKEIYSFESDVQAVNVVTLNGNFNIEKNPQAAKKPSKKDEAPEVPAWTVTMNSTAVTDPKLDDTKTGTYMAQLKSLKCVEWMPDDTAVPSAELASVTVITKDGQVKVTVYQKSDSDKYLCGCSAVPYLFKLNANVGEKYLKSLAELM